MKIFFLILLSFQFGKASVENVFNSNLPMEKRWDSFQNYIKKNPKESRKIAKKALNSSDWFLREAGLKTYMALDEKEAKKIARMMLVNDPSLLVRSSALQAMKILKDKDSKEILLRSLNDPRNFRKDQSLWIRPQIVSMMLDLDMLTTKDLNSLKNDKDPKIVKLAYGYTKQ